MKIDNGTAFELDDTIYTIKALIKSGGFGSAYLLGTRNKAFNFDGRDAVLKVPSEAVLNDAEMLQRFDREARILSSINHAHVVKIIAYVDTILGNPKYKGIIQELVPEHSNLTDYVKTHPGSAPSILLQALYGVRCIHEGTNPSVIHRDLSPSNILVSGSGVVKLIDFGLAKQTPRESAKLTGTGVDFGTPGCMSPEQHADSGSVDHRTDLYSIGKSFAAAILDRHPSVVQLSALAEPWRTICSGLAADSPNDRPSSATQAIGWILSEFNRSDLSLDTFDVHAEEMQRWLLDPPGWQQLISNEFLTRRTPLTLNCVRTLHKLRPSVFCDPGLAQALFDHLEASPEVHGILSREYSAGDQLGELYVRLFPSLDEERRLLAFERLCKVAAGHNRYSVMHDVRNAYRTAGNQPIQARLDEILEREDPGKLIHGRGVLNRSP